ncbi:MAG: metallophosphoesterase [Paludibacter sp.]|nr:metallophosphoesterase [Paludibacter sp.]
MKMYTGILLLLLVMIAIPDIFFYLKLKDRNVRPIYIFLHLIPPIFFTAIFLYIKFGLEIYHNFRVVAWIMWMYFVFLLIYIPKLIHIVFFFMHFLYQKLFKRDSVYFIIIRIALSALVVVVMMISAYITPRNFDVTHVHVLIPNLPKAFNGYKIVQISDIHLGSWGRKYRKLKKVIKLVNAQNADIIVFTGDMVNNFATETVGWQSYFLQMKAKGGKYAILGNHDYGDYTDWKSLNDRLENRNQIKQSIRNFGFRLLLNEHLFLYKGKDSLMLVGVENWGKTEKFRYSNLSEALRGGLPSAPKILLAHDPNQFDAEIIRKQDIVLTLAGHTHAGQMGIRIGNKLFSPASFVFKYWAGLYKVGRQYIYVNRGIGYIGLPMFIGVRPEITVIELHISPKQ